jgi:hypothetical protein
MSRKKVHGLEEAMSQRIAKELNRSAPGVYCYLP